MENFKTATPSKNKIFYLTGYRKMHELNVVVTSSVTHKLYKWNSRYTILVSTIIKAK